MTKRNIQPNDLPSSVANGIIDPTNVGFDVIFCLGQSNMSGAGTGYDLTHFDPVDPRIFTYGSPSVGISGALAAVGAVSAYAGILSQAAEPVANYSASGSLGGNPGMSMAIPFAREWVRHVPNNRSVIVVNAAYGGTGFEGADSHGGTLNWRAGGNSLYPAALAQLAAAMAIPNAEGQVNNLIVATLWHQGEQDSSNGTTGSAYQTDFDAMIADLQSRFPGIPFVCGQMTKENIAKGGSYAAINNVHVNTPARDVLTGFAYGPPLGYTDPVNGIIHFSAAAQRLNGVAYYAAYKRALMNVLGKAPIVPSGLAITQLTASTASLTWAQPSGRVTDFKIELNFNSAGWVTQTDPASIDTTFTITGRAQGDVIQARVSSTNDQGISAPSAVTSLTMATVPAQVTGLAAGTPTSTNVTLTWNAASGAAQYLVEYQLGSGAWQTSQTVTGTSATVGGLSASTTYNFRVTAQNIAGSGTSSSPVGATTTASVAFVTDTFSGTTGVAITSRVPDLGAQPTIHPANSTMSSPVITAANRARLAGTTGGCFYYPTAPSSANYTVKADLFADTLLAGASFGVIGRVAGSAGTGVTGYVVRWEQNNGLWRVFALVAGVSTTLGTLTATLTAGSTYSIAMAMNGTTITATVTSGGSTQTIWTGTDSSISAAGFPGGYGAASTAETDTTGFHLDNFVAAA